MDGRGILLSLAWWTEWWFARGSTDNKGQIFAHMIGVAEKIKAGGPETDVIFVVEGEEEVGSDNLEGVFAGQERGSGV